MTRESCTSLDFRDRGADLWKKKEITSAITCRHFAGHGTFMWRNQEEEETEHNGESHFRELLKPSLLS